MALLNSLESVKKLYRTERGLNLGLVSIDLADPTVMSERFAYLTRPVDESILILDVHRLRFV